MFAFWVRDAVDREEKGFTIESKLGVMPAREYILYYFFFLGLCIRESSCMQVESYPNVTAKFR